MAGVDWALVVLVGYPLVQVPLVFYLGRQFTLDGDTPVTATMAYWTGEEATVGRGDWGSPDPGRCRHCGGYNEPDYTFCGQCAARL